MKEKLGITLPQLGALIGLNYEGKTLRETAIGLRLHRNQILLWLMLRYPELTVEEQLLYWATTRPKNEEHFALLRRTAHELLPPDMYLSWEETMRFAHPRFFA